MVKLRKWQDIVKEPLATEIQGLIDGARSEGRRAGLSEAESMCVQMTNIGDLVNPDPVSLAMTELKCRLRIAARKGGE